MKAQEALSKAWFNMSLSSTDTDPLLQSALQVIYELQAVLANLGAHYVPEVLVKTRLLIIRFKYLIFQQCPQPKSQVH